ncbi:50S ribosomal protein L25 [Paenibacillus xerothermodurans]|uniref:Large ribosomal subunit protein bL25 n=1 Tax=Paenibacillus xerothermodurans TaxID=1977292 RepID=A0A2W1NU45_PAEXE|nr:50S ribosomal protein L25 [Paenibacillus xerothermodurans]PZE19202.1 50S ribosomal protein L25 [Paenibacillus xerothermodurans]
MATTMKAEERKNGTNASRRGLRESGKIPAVIYGSKIESLPIAIEERELLSVLRTNPHAIIELDVPQMGKQPVMINEVQRDTINKNVIHVDFHQIDMDEPVSAAVRLEYVGDPAGVKAGGVLQIQHHEVEVRCLPKNMPAAIEVDISHLEVGMNILVSELKVPDGVEVRTDENDVLATVLAPTKAAEDAEAAPEAEAEASS